MMSMVTVSSLERISASRLAEMLLAQASRATTTGTGTDTAAAIADSEDPTRVAIVDVRDDDYIGGHIRSSMHFASQSLDATMPTLLRKLADKETVVFHCALSQQRGPAAALRYLREREAASGKGNAGGEKKKQTVYVLDRGFVGWQEVYGNDERLTEGYRKELWEDY
ncbi:Rhodanese-like protein [Xylariaceae sp. FL0255]|nr:Rhodanese-like protein [Xylariaceae sp. FL0255]